MPKPCQRPGCRHEAVPTWRYCPAHLAVERERLSRSGYLTPAPAVAWEGDAARTPIDDGPSFAEGPDRRRRGGVKPAG